MTVSYREKARLLTLLGTNRLVTVRTDSETTMTTTVGFLAAAIGGLIKGAARVID